MRIDSSDCVLAKRMQEVGRACGCGSTRRVNASNVLRERAFDTRRVHLSCARQSRSQQPPAVFWSPFKAASHVPFSSQCAEILVECDSANAARASVDWRRCRLYRVRCSSVAVRRQVQMCHARCCTQALPYQAQTTFAESDSATKGAKTIITGNSSTHSTSPR